MFNVCVCPSQLKANPHIYPLFSGYNEWKSLQDWLQEMQLPLDETESTLTSYIDGCMLRMQSAV